jgi:hypothetical protein
VKERRADGCERQVHEQGLASVLRQTHDDRDAAVAGAYGWSTLSERSAPKGTADLAGEVISRWLVALSCPSWFLQAKSAVHVSEDTRPYAGLA